jgi:anti-sigma-K factor RskA
VSNHDQFRELIEGYALGSLDSQDVAAFEAHLATGCADCAKALEEARWVVSQLAYLAPPAEPPETLKGRLLQTVRTEAVATPESPARAPRAVPWWLWAGVAALLLFSAYSAWNTHRLQTDIAALQAQSEAQRKQRQKLEQELLAATMKAHEAIILSDPASVKIKLPAKDPNMPQLEAMWHPQLGIVVRGWKVPMPAEKRVLQLWLIPKAPGKKPMPSMTFWPDADGKFVLMVANPPDAMSDTQALAITEEPVGGSPQPTGTPMWVGGVS